MNKMKKSGRLTPFEWGYYYIHRYWRLAPPFLIAIIINVTIIPWLGSGPLWQAEDFRKYKNEGCYTYWWAYLLFVNNFVPKSAEIPTCMGPLWYIPNDYQYYALSPIFLVILYK
jgi:peptidoglycan/LPS O-acetylase OafA/YrhL